MVVGFVAGVVYVAVHRDTSHEFDTYWMLPALAADSLVLPANPLAAPVAEAWIGLLAFTGEGLRTRLALAGGISSGVAIGILVHAAWLVLADLRRAIAAGLLFAALPSVAYFATVMELHGLFLPAAAAATWWGCRTFARRDEARWSNGLWLGLLTAVATAMHGTGHFFTGALMVWLASELRAAGGRWRWLAWGTAAAAMHVAALLVIRWLVLPGDGVPSGSATLVRWENPGTLRDVHRVV